MTTFNFSAPPPHPSPPPFSPSPPFKPSIAVVVGVLTTMFSITLLMLLYAKHCKRGNGIIYNGFNADTHITGGGPGTSIGRKNSGVDRTVIESLPIFRFSSLRGQKDGLECAVCLNRFESPEVLRLLPKCKHAFHVECVDTWLDAHSTCPLCRYRVEPEDILLIDHDSVSGTPNLFHPNRMQLPDSEISDIEMGRAEKQAETEVKTETIGSDGYRRISGRHSWAGEKGSASLSQIVVQRTTSGSERVPHRSSGQGPARRSLDSYGLMRKKNNESVTVGCFDRYPSHQRKDGLLLINGDGNSEHCGSRKSAGPDKLRFEHRINIVTGSGVHQRWSDVQPSDLLYLRSEMIICELAYRPSVCRRQKTGDGGEGEGEGGERRNGRNVINTRSVSEITGLNRFIGRESNNNRDGGERQAGVVSRWLAWISSRSQSQADLSLTHKGLSFA
ncbi:RING-H2 finger protein ATL43 [Euphorbia lathyris]|uniref:RING-H2 finger protein ATL43 n=1 Tax=Euphorbia lathyris TaxID=212925 RepID=UPI00331340FE